MLLLEASGFENTDNYLITKDIKTESNIGLLLCNLEKNKTHLKSILHYKVTDLKKKKTRKK